MSEPAVVSASGYLSEFAEDTHIPVQRFNDCVFSCGLSLTPLVWPGVC